MPQRRTRIQYAAEQLIRRSNKHRIRGMAEMEVYILEGEDVLYVNVMRRTGRYMIEKDKLPKKYFGFEVSPGSFITEAGVSALNRMGRRW